MIRSSFLNRKSLMVIAAVVAVLLIGIAVFYFIAKKSKSNSEMAKTEAGPAISVVKVESLTLFREDQIPGEINAYQDVLIYPKVPGFVKWLGVDRGSVVKKDQLLAEMYAPEYIARRNEALSKVAAAKASVASTESKLEDIEADLRRAKANLLADQSTYQRVNAASMAPGVIADNDVIQWSQTVQVDREDVDALIKRVNAKNKEVLMRKQELSARGQAFSNYATFSSYLEIRAPFDGYITERRMHVGSFVGPDGKGAYPPICRIKQLDLLRIVAPVPEIDTNAVIAGSEVQFTVSSFPGQRFTGTIARIANDLDKDTRTMPVELNYLNRGYKILPGMFCKIYWPTRRRYSSMFVPVSAVASTPLDTFVCRIKDGVVDWVSVTKGERMDGMVEIFSHRLQAGDYVAKEANEQLRDQSTVKTEQRVL